MTSWHKDQTIKTIELSDHRWQKYTSHYAILIYFDFRLILYDISENQIYRTDVSKILHTMYDSSNNDLMIFFYLKFEYLKLCNDFTIKLDTLQKLALRIDKVLKK